MNIPFSRKQILLVLASAAALVIIAIALIATHSRKPSEEVLQGREYLSQLEQGDPTSVDERLAQIEEEKLQANMAALRESLLQDPDQVWSQFTDFVIIGDSRAEGFSAYEFLPANRVMAVKGLTISYLYSDEVAEALQTLQPTKVWLAFGNNDIGDSENPGWLENWIGNYREAVENVRNLLPNATVFVCSVLPVVEPSSEESYFDAIPAVNEALAGMCAQTGAVFEDASKELEGHPEYYEPDGMHFTIKFYPVWATDMLLKYYDVVGSPGSIPGVSGDTQSNEDTAAEEVSDSGDGQEASGGESAEELYGDEEDTDETDYGAEDQYGYEEADSGPEVVYWDEASQMFIRWNDELQLYTYLDDWEQQAVYWDEESQQYVLG